MDNDARKIVEQARKGFGHDLFTPGYAQIISDAEHLTRLIRLSELRTGKSYLDIGTGGGYIAFEFIRQNPEISVVGIDIVENIVAVNNQKVKESKNSNIRFMSYNGMTMPFSDSTFHGVVSRYAFHHFPQPALSAFEIHRILEPGGWCIISDPMADPADDGDFVNRFGALKNDGHVRYYPEMELMDIFIQAGFEPDSKFYSAITFPRELDERYTKLLANTPPHILERYKIRVEKDSIYITVQVMNIRLRKPALVA